MFSVPLPWLEVGFNFVSRESVEHRIDIEAALDGSRDSSEFYTIFHDLDLTISAYLRDRLRF